MHEVLVNRLGGLSLPRKSVVRLTDRPNMTLDVNRGRKTTIQHLFLEATLYEESSNIVSSMHICEVFVLLFYLTIHCRIYKNRLTEAILME